MAITQFRLLEYALRYDGYKCEMLGNCGSAVAQLGLKYVHNDTCYPALLVIGQFLDALNSGKYDLDHTALLITQTGGGCRASNYIKLLRKALVKAGYPQYSRGIAELLRSGKGQRLPDDPAAAAQGALRRIFYGDMLCRPAQPDGTLRERQGRCRRMEKWIATLGPLLLAGKGFTSQEMKHTFPLIAKDFAAISRHPGAQGQGGRCWRDLRQVQPAGQQRPAEVSGKSGLRGELPGPDGLCAVLRLQYGRGSCPVRRQAGCKGRHGPVPELAGRHRARHAQGRADAGFYAPGSFKELVEKPKGIISLGAKMGEGWLLTAEMIELVQGGYGNIVCAQPFGCLPNHIVGKGMVNKIRALYPSANITPIDYDPSATRVNQENRIKLMLAVAKERLNAPAQAAQPTAEEIAGGAAV